MLEIKLFQVSERKWSAQIGEWKTGPAILKATNRRAVAYLKSLDGELKGKAELERYRNAPKKQCPRCKGSGGLNQYLHVARGVCFKCGGDGVVEKNVAKIA